MRRRMGAQPAKRTRRLENVECERMRDREVTVSNRKGLTSDRCVVSEMYSIFLVAPRGSGRGRQLLVASHGQDRTLLFQGVLAREASRRPDIQQLRFQLPPLLKNAGAQRATKKPHLKLSSHHTILSSARPPFLLTSLPQLLAVRNAAAPSLSPAAATTRNFRHFNLCCAHLASTTALFSRL